MKNKVYIKLIFFIFINTLFFVSAGRYSWGMGDRIVAVVNDEIITESELGISRVFSQKSISFLIEKKIQIQIAKKKGIFVQSSEVLSAIEDVKRANSFKSDKEFEEALQKEGNSLEEYKKELTEQLTLLKLINKEIKSKIAVGDKELEEYYSAHKDNFSLPEEIRVGYIYISVKPSDPVETIQRAQKRMNEMLSNLKDNIPFRDIKKRYSEVSEVQVSEDLGFVKKGELLQEVDIVAFSLKEGEISDVIETPTGLYIVKVLEKRKSGYSQFIDVKDIVRDILFQEKSERLYKEWLYEMKSSSYIEVRN